MLALCLQGNPNQFLGMDCLNHGRAREPQNILNSSSFLQFPEFPKGLTEADFLSVSSWALGCKMSHHARLWTLGYPALGRCFCGSGNLKPCVISSSSFRVDLKHICQSASGIVLLDLDSEFPNPIQFYSDLRSSRHFPLSLLQHRKDFPLRAGMRRELFLFQNPVHFGVTHQTISLEVRQQGSVEFSAPGSSNSDSRLPTSRISLCK